VEIYKVTEPSSGVMSLDIANGIQLSSGLSLTAFKSEKRSNKLLAIGDSITCGYGVEGVSPCGYSTSTENSILGWSSIIANNIDADLHVVAWSGKGVVRNYMDVDQLSEFPMTAYYNRTLGNKPLGNDNYWDPNVSSFIPTMILVHLGTNDFSTKPTPTEEQFTTGLINFVGVLHNDYPNAKIGLICSPMMSSIQCDYIENAAKATDSAYSFVPPAAMIKPDGCDGHPSVAAQASIADYVMPAVESML